MFSFLERYVFIFFISVFFVHGFCESTWAAAPPKPTLLNPNRSPVNGQSFLLQWTHNAADFIYELDEDTKSNFSTPTAPSYWPTSNYETIPSKTAATYYFRVRAWSNLPSNAGQASSWSNTITVKVMTDNAFEDLIAQNIYNYFIATTYSNGLTRDRYATSNNTETVASTAASGFYLSALTVGAKRGWISKTSASTRAQTALQTFQSVVPQVNGFFYHYLNADGSASNTPFREVSSIDTAIFIAGALQAGEYFGGTVKTLADNLYKRVQWNWMYDQDSKIMHQAWTESGGITGDYGSYSEAILLYLLAIGSPTYPIPAESFYSMDRPKGNYSGTDFIFTSGGQIFTYQYPQAWFDFRTTTDALGVNWWQNSIEGVRANQRFCIDNPGFGYSQYLWGISASDGPDLSVNPYGYKAYGAPPAYGYIHDGTIAPTAVGASIAMASDIALPSLKYMYGVYGDQIWKTYGFVDSFNPGTGWVDNYYVGIDQGAIILMLENKRNQTIWTNFMANEHVKRSLARARFSGFAPTAVVLEDFEDGNMWTPDTTTGWWEGDGATVYHRANSSSPVFAGLVSMQVQYAKSGLPYSLMGANFSSLNSKRDFSRPGLLTLNVYGSCNLLVKFRNKSLAEQDVTTLRAKNPNGWNRLVFDYSNLNISTSDMDNILFFVDPGNDASIGTIYVDDLKLEVPNPLTIENFEDGNSWTPDTSLGWWDTDGSAVYQRSFSKDPSHGGMGAMRLDYNKNGLPWSLTAGFISAANPLRDFTQRTRLTVWVRGQGTLLVKLRDRQFTEAEIGSASVNNSYVWKKLTFDYTGVDSINMSDIDNILFFVNPGDSASSGTLYLDDIALE